MRVGAGLVAVEPGSCVFAALVLHLALAGTLAPAALKFLIQREAHPAIVGHLFAPGEKIFSKLILSKITQQVI